MRTEEEIRKEAERCKKERDRAKTESEKITLNARYWAMLWVLQEHDIVCEFCGKLFDEPRYYKPYNKLCSSECFHEKFWVDVLKDKDKHIIVDGNVYSIGGDTASGIKGFGGALFRIKKNNGDYIETDNLWYLGEVPEKYKNQLPDNAVFIFNRINDRSHPLL
ncbi:MAG: hypothetical protein ACOX8A_11450 [Thermacetogeniaceae bacterium]